MIGPFYTDIQLARMIDPTGSFITARSIRTEREHGRLRGTKIAGKWVYAHSDVVAFLEATKSPRPIPPTEQSDSPVESTASVLSELKRRGRKKRARTL